jgi:hypothetical protein
MIKTGDRTCCLIGEWNGTAAIAGAHSEMIDTLNSFRPPPEEPGAGLGITDAVCGRSC